MDIGELTVKYDLTKSLLHLIRNDVRWRAELRSVEAASDSTEQHDIISLNFEVVGLCQYPVYDIKALEPIDIYISDDSMPTVLLRPDFPAVPHLDIYSDGIKRMCYSELSFNELRHKMNGRFLLECINNWFVKTARNELHRQDQSLEPFFPYVNDTIILNPPPSNQLFCRFRRCENSVGTVLIQDDDDMSGENFAVLTLAIEAKSSNVIHQMPETLNHILNMFPEETAYSEFAEWLRQLLLIKTKPKEYNSRFQQSDNQLQNCRCLFVLLIPLIRQSNGKTDGCDFRAFITNCKLSAVIKDFGFIVNKSKLEHDPRKDNWGKNIKLAPYNAQLDISSSSARIYNGENGDKQQLNLSIIGAGALGSQIVSNCVHSGFGEWTVIDDDILWPHNIARHALTREDIGRSKAEALAEAMKKVTIDAKINAIAQNIFTESEVIKKALADSDIIIDASASPAVERHLAIEQQSAARKVSFFLNPQGNSTVMLFEDERRDIRLDLLETQYYATLLSNEKYAAHLSVPDTLAYSGTCRSITSRLSQDNIALSAALCCKALKESSKKTEAAINIWTHNNGNVNLDKIDVNGWDEINVSGWKVYMFKPLINTIHSQRQSNIPNETGGVLIGAFDYARKFLYLVAQIESPDDSISSPTSYVRGCCGLEQRLKKIEDVVKDNLYYVGEWHSHPNLSTQMSRDDKNLLSVIVEYNRERCKPSCMLIIGSSGHSIYIDE